MYLNRLTNEQLIFIAICDMFWVKPTNDGIFNSTISMNGIKAFVSVFSCMSYLGCYIVMLTKNITTRDNHKHKHFLFFFFRLHNEIWFINASQPIEAINFPRNGYNCDCVAKMPKTAWLATKQMPRKCLQFGLWYFEEKKRNNSRRNVEWKYDKGCRHTMKHKGT